MPPHSGADEPSVGTRTLELPARRDAHSTEDGRMGLQQRSPEFALTVLDNSLDGVLAHTLDGHLVYFNDTAAAQLGYTHDEFARLGPYGWIEDDNIGLVPSRLALIVERGSLLFNSRGAPKDGAVMHTEVNARLVRDGDQDMIISIVRDVTERIYAQEYIRHLAFHDRLTGLANRVKLEDDLKAALAAADRHGDLVGVIFLDLDDFKPINDELGHAVGDYVLKQVADRLRSCVREVDTVARLGGDEFLVVVTRLVARADLAAVASKLEDTVGLPIPIEGHPDARVTASAGLATYEHGEAAEDLMNRADHAMYRARLEGTSGREAFLAQT
jgi:diguanylate cyclase (GGDEF)-like protein/PAS domain S-box-containing protein